MQHKQAVFVFLALTVIVTVLGGLAYIAVPHAGQMAYQSKAEDRETERLRIEWAVLEMLRQSPSGSLKPAGPLNDLTLVRTADASPLWLKDYLPNGIGAYLHSGYAYSFTADGTVIQNKTN